MKAKATKTIRCPECQKKADYVLAEPRVVACCDCGKEFTVEPLDTETVRCVECNKIHIRETNRLRKQRQREREKLCHGRLSTSKSILKTAEKPQ